MVDRVTWCFLRVPHLSGRAGLAFGAHARMRRKNLYGRAIRTGLTSIEGASPAMCRPYLALLPVLARIAVTDCQSGRTSAPRGRSLARTAALFRRPRSFCACSLETVHARGSD